jgi:hypothetical protein
MEIQIKWRKTKQVVDCADVSTVREDLPKPLWIDFDHSDITRSHFLDLFSGKIMVLIRQDDTVISNDKDIRHTYHKRGDVKVIALDKIERNEGKLSEVGFL